MCSYVSLSNIVDIYLKKKFYSFRMFPVYRYIQSRWKRKKTHLKPNSINKSLTSHSNKKTQHFSRKLDTDISVEKNRKKLIKSFNYNLLYNHVYVIQNFIPCIHPVQDIFIFYSIYLVLIKIFWSVLIAFS